MENNTTKVNEFLPLSIVMKHFSCFQGGDVVLGSPLDLGIFISSGDDNPVLPRVLLLDLFIHFITKEEDLFIIKILSLEM